MSKITQAKKEAKAKGKQAKIAAANAKKAAAPKEETAKAKKPAVPNFGKCATCKSYSRCKGRAEPCKTTGKYTPRKATCQAYDFKD